MTNDKPKKSERTREKIVEAALELFREHGYDGTTMALVAEKASVSKGNAYYYFRSKDELVQAFYLELQAAHAARTKRTLLDEGTFGARLRVALLDWQELARPYHAFADKLFRNAADPRSPLSPFSPDSAPAREASIAIFDEVIADADERIDPELRRVLPSLLWLLHMGIVLFWVFDQSTMQAKSRLLVERVVPIVDRLVQASSNPLLRPLRDEALRTLAELAPDLATRR